MDKKRLNNEIILCRPAVRKAKVAVIRKLIKKMKILKSCKVEAMKEKKLKKSERLFKKVQVMKRIKPDEVTKFALRHNDIEAFIKTSKLNIKENAMSHLARHKAVVKKVNFIREQIQDWEVQLPILLDSLGKKKKKLVNKQETAKNSCKTTLPKAKDMEGGSDRQDIQVKSKSSVSGKMNHSEKTELGKQSSRTTNDSGRSRKGNEKLEQITKIEDPFFIGKKMVAPKLVLESLSNNKNSDKLKKYDSPSIGRENVDISVFDRKPFKEKRNLNEIKSGKPAPKTEVEKLHPSWAAKKVKLIKPFQGKKITFSDD